ncbi:MAG: YdcF family protein [Clostridia bacterium]|nr:YdcF family protein [Clostridia bacterium]
MLVFYIIAAILVVLLALVAVVNRAVVWEASRSEIYDCNKEINIDKKYGCILVLGAGVRPDGTPSHMLEDRLRGAVALYEAGVSDVLLLSGDNSGEDYDEVSAMVKYCLEHGVPESAIVRDDIGFSTSESVYNTVRTLGYRDIIVVTQEYHLYRAMYMIKRMGADADGFATDYRAYSMQIKRDVREYVARCKDFLKVNISLHK